MTWSLLPICKRGPRFHHWHRDLLQNRMMLIHLHVHSPCETRPFMIMSNSHSITCTHQKSGSVRNRTQRHGTEPRMHTFGTIAHVHLTHTHTTRRSDRDVTQRTRYRVHPHRLRQNNATKICLCDRSMGAHFCYTFVLIHADWPHIFLSIPQASFWGVWLSQTTSLTILSPSWWAPNLFCERERALLSKIARVIWKGIKEHNW
jgi:hypothetical protein